MKNRDRITIRAAALAIAIACLLPLTSCFHNNWNIPEREEIDLDLGMILGGLAGQVGDIKEKEVLPSGVVLVLSEDGGHYIVADASECTAKRISIPASYRGVPVAEIADGAFAGLKALEEISLPGSIKSVGAGVFDGCDLLKYTKDGDYYYVGNNENPHLVLIRASKDTLSGNQIHENTRVIAAEAFMNNMLIKQFAIPDGIVTIGKRAFKKCTNLHTVDIGNGVETIGDEAFSGDGALINLEIGSAVITIGDSAFKDADRLESVDIPDSVTEIGASAFYSCNKLGKVMLGDAVKTINDKAFAYCYLLESIMLSESVKRIGHLAFWGCSSLESVSLPSNIDMIFSDSFRGCSSLIYSTYANGRYLGSMDHPYMYLMDIIETSPSTNVIMLHRDTRRIAATLLSSHSELSSIIVPDDAKYLHVDQNCLIDTAEKKLVAGIASSEIPDDGSVALIADYAFYGIADLDITRIPLSVTEIGDYAFALCGSLYELTIEGARKIGDGAFQHCIKLERVSLKSDLGSIGEYAFENCQALVKIAIPDSVSDIGAYAFKSCISIAYVYISARIYNIPEGLFEGCTSLISANHGTELASVGAYAFSNCKKLEIFDFNDGLEYIGDSAFAKCRTLGAIRLPNSVIEIGEYAFDYCTSVTAMSIGSGIKRIGKDAFKDLGVDNFLYNGNLGDWHKVDFGAQSRGMTVIFTDGTSLFIPAEGAVVRY